MKGRSTSRPQRPHSGFTALEALIAVAVAAAVVTAAVVGLSGLRARKQSEGLSQELVADLVLARSAALGGARPVHLLTSSDGRGYRVLSCDSLETCPADSPVLKSVDLPASHQITPLRRFAFQAPRGLLGVPSQSVCVLGPASTPILKVELRDAVSQPQVCAVGGAVGLMPACASGC